MQTCTRACVSAQPSTSTRIRLHRHQFLGAQLVPTVCSVDTDTHSATVEYRGHLRDVVALRVEPHVVGRVPDLFEDAPHVLPRPTAHILKDDDLRPNLMYSL